MTTLVAHEEVAQLREMAAELGIALQEIPEPALSDPALDAGTLESVKQDLNDLYNLFEAPGSETIGPEATEDEDSEDG